MDFGSREDVKFIQAHERDIREARIVAERVAREVVLERAFPYTIKRLESVVVEADGTCHRVKGVQAHKSIAEKAGLSKGDLGYKQTCESGFIFFFEKPNTNSREYYKLMFLSGVSLLTDNAVEALNKKGYVVMTETEHGYDILERDDVHGHKILKTVITKRPRR